MNSAIASRLITHLRSHLPQDFTQREIESALNAMTIDAVMRMGDSERILKMERLIIEQRAIDSASAPSVAKGTP